MTIDAMKRAAARAALEEVPDHSVIGLGTGSTVHCFLDVLADAIRAGRRVVGVPSSEATRVYATGLGIPLLPDEGPWSIAVTIDGADEVTHDLDLIKGAGGALTREKIVSFSSARTVIIIDERKLSVRLGEQCRVPIEVLRFAHLTTQGHLAQHGVPRWRQHGGVPIVTDGGNFLYDLAVDPIADPRALDRALHQIPGVVETGLFVGRADLVVIGASHGIVKLTRKRAP